MEENKTAAEENRIIREKRLKRGKIESRAYTAVFTVLALAVAIIAGKTSILTFALLISPWLFFAAPFGRHLYSWGNLAYGFYVFYIFTYIMPLEGITSLQIIAILIFILYIIFSSVKVFSSDSIKAYLYDKNND